MKKRFNINLDDSAFTKERTPVCIFNVVCERRLGVSQLTLASIPAGDLTRSKMRIFILKYISKFFSRIACMIMIHNSFHYSRLTDRISMCLYFSQSRSSSLHSKRDKTPPAPLHSQPNLLLSPWTSPCLTQSSSSKVKAMWLLLLREKVPSTCSGLKVLELQT